VYVLNPSNGKPRLRFRAHDSIYSTPAVSGDIAVVGNFSGEFYVFNGNKRNWPLEYELTPYWWQVWAFGLAPHPPVESGLLWGIDLGSNISSSPARQGDMAYLGVDNKLIAMDLKGEKKAWSFVTAGSVKSSPALAGGLVFVGSDDGKIYALNATDGSKTWEFATGDKVGASPVIANGVLFVGSFDGKMYAIK
jgi:outer membrane protein assembly factor BamB